MDDIEFRQKLNKALGKVDSASSQIATALGIDRSTLPEPPQKGRISDERKQELARLSRPQTPPERR